MLILGETPYILYRCCQPSLKVLRTITLCPSRSLDCSWTAGRSKSHLSFATRRIGGVITLVATLYSSLVNKIRILMRIFCIFRIFSNISIDFLLNSFLPLQIKVDQYVCIKLNTFLKLDRDTFKYSNVYNLYWWQFLVTRYLLML